MSLFMTFIPLTNCCLTRSKMEAAINVSHLSILSTLIIQPLPVDGGSDAPGLVPNSTFYLLVLPLRPSFGALQCIGVVNFGLPTKEEAAKALALNSDTITSPATSPVPLILSCGAIALRSCTSSVDDNAACWPSKDLFTRSCFCLAILELFIEFSRVAT